MQRHLAFRKTEMVERTRFVHLWLGGMSFRGIADKTGASATTVQRWVRRWQREGTLHTRTYKQPPKSPEQPIPSVPAYFPTMVHNYEDSPHTRNYKMPPKTPKQPILPITAYFPRESQNAEDIITCPQGHQPAKQNNLSNQPEQPIPSFPIYFPRTTQNHEETIAFPEPQQTPKKNTLWRPTPWKPKNHLNFCKPNAELRMRYEEPSPLEKCLAPYAGYLAYESYNTHIMSPNHYLNKLRIIYPYELCNIDYSHLREGL